MSQETLDLRWIVRRIWTAVGAVAAWGLLAGIAVAALHPPMLTSTALVVLPQAGQNAAAAPNGEPDPFTATQEVIAESNPVLLRALPDVRPATSLTELRREVQIGSLTPYVISISAKGKTASDAEATANAVADSYIAYVGSPSSPFGRVPAELLQSATNATGRPLLIDLLITGGLGALLGVLVGAIDALAFSRRGLWFRQLPQ
jgi:capsular polysaccharide biosynthesis protein